MKLNTSIKVAASGIVALCLLLAATFYVQSAVNPSVASIGDKFFGLAVVLIIMVVILALVKIKIKLP